MAGNARRLTTILTVTLILALVASTSAASAFWWWGGSDADTAPGDEPVLLVHGFADSSWTLWWDALESNLKDDGYTDDEIYRLDLGGLLTTVDSPEEYAEQVCDELAAISLAHGGSDVDVVAHSMGGLDARWCIEKGGGAQYVDDLVTLGTPHQGTDAAHLGFFTEGGRDMIPGSPFLTELNGDELASSVDYTSVYGTADVAVIPNERATIPDGKHGEADVATVKAGFYGHLALVWNEDVYDDYDHRLD